MLNHRLGYLRPISQLLVLHLKLLIRAIKILNFFKASFILSYQSPILLLKIIKLLPGILTLR